MALGAFQEAPFVWVVRFGFVVVAAGSYKVCSRRFFTPGEFIKVRVLCRPRRLCAARIIVGVVPSALGLDFTLAARSAPRGFAPQDNNSDLVSCAPLRVLINRENGSDSHGSQTVP